jgi:hypothetical protein
VPLGELNFELSGDFLGSEGQRAALWALVGMLGSFAFIRFSTRMIRAQVSWWPGNIETSGGLHIHHLVFGIVLLMLAGFLEFALQPGSPGTEVLAALFGIGAGLTLDEFALWLHLEDVYWAQEGRQSVDAVIFATLIAVGFLVGTVPLGFNEASSAVAVVVVVVVHLGFAVVSALKGKYTSAIVGMVVPPVIWVAAIRVARPGSYWARRRYADDSPRLARATAREQRRHRRRSRAQELIGGIPGAPGEKAD